MLVSTSNANTMFALAYDRGILLCICLILSNTNTDFVRAHEKCICTENTIIYLLNYLQLTSTEIKSMPQYN